MEACATDYSDNDLHEHPETVGAETCGTAVRRQPQGRQQRRRRLADIDVAAALVGEARAAAEPQDDEQADAAAEVGLCGRSGV